MQTTQKNKIVALATLGAMSFATFAPMATPAEASVKGRRNTTIALGAVTAYGLLKHKKGVAIAGAAGTAYAYSRYRKAKKIGQRRRARRYRYGRRR